MRGRRAADQRPEGCWSGTTVPFGFAIVVSEVCFSADSRYRAEHDNLDDPRDDGNTSSGTYTIDGYRLTLADDAGAQERGAFAILAGSRDAPTSLMINGERLSVP